jgi:hypothetical protein
MTRLFPQKEQTMQQPNEETVQALLEGRCRIGFRYKFEHIRNGVVIDTEVVDNIIPDEGRDYLMNAGLNAGTQFSTWYIGLYENNYTPVDGDTMATFPASAGELTTSYDETARVTLVDGALDDGLWGNVASPAEFTFNATKTVRGGFISSGSVKNGTTGVLLSAVKAGTAKNVEDTDVLRVTAGITLTSS